MASKLKLYQSIKQVHAEPMTFGHFNTTIRAVPGGEKFTQESPGYHVVYGLGTPDEYHSWSPKDIFDAGNVEIPEPVKDAHD